MWQQLGMYTWSKRPAEIQFSVPITVKQHEVELQAVTEPPAVPVSAFGGQCSAAPAVGYFLQCSCRSGFGISTRPAARAR